MPNMPSTRDRRSVIIGLNITTATPLDALVCPHRRRPDDHHRDCRAPWRLTLQPAIAITGSLGAGKVRTGERR